jgi:zinc/manganese transport system substrate-binding protein
LAPYQNRIADIKKTYGGMHVAATEDIFEYLASATGLNLISPSAFTSAVAEGNDPSASSVATFQQQLQNHQPAVLVFNEQTVTPLTTSMKNLASQANIPIVGITETLQPKGASFEDWMDAEITSLQQALATQKGVDHV